MEERFSFCAALMKKDAAADEEVEVDAVVMMGAGSPGWLQLLTLQGVRVLLLQAGVMVVVVAVVTRASDGATSLSASPIKPWPGLG